MPYFILQLGITVNSDAGVKQSAEKFETGADRVARKRCYNAGEMEIPRGRRRQEMS